MSGNYDYCLFAKGCGPKGAFSGSGYMKFTDASGDTYRLSIYKHAYDMHTVNYNSDQPKIVKFEWGSSIGDWF